MKYLCTALICILSVFSCPAQESNIDIFEALVKQHTSGSMDDCELFVNIAKGFINNPYVEATLDQQDKENLVINLKEFDCTTFIESCLALTLTINSADPNYKRFISTLKDLRYIDGVINGYSSRHHYVTDWINANQRHVKDITLELGGSKIEKEINFMTTHITSYPMLTKDSSEIKLIKQREDYISDSEFYNYIKKQNIHDIVPKLKSGDIVVFATNIKGLDYTHMGIILKEKSKARLLHASSKYKKVIIDPKDLETYCNDSKSCVGITVLRLK